MHNTNNVNMDARCQMKVIRRDGSIEYHEQDWSSLSEEQKSSLLQIPSFRAWFHSKLTREGGRSV